MAHVSNLQFRNLLVEELEGKKPYVARFDTACDLSGTLIEQGEEFFFFGDKKKVCNNCRDQMAILVAEQVH